MKLFIYKTLIVVFSAYILFQFTIGKKIKNYESKIYSLSNKNEREKIADKLREEIRAANNKENILNKNDKELLSNFINKLVNELSAND